MSGRKGSGRDNGRRATHPWTLCRPTPVDIDDPVAAEAVNAATQRVWATVESRSRRLFHELVCEGQQTGVHLTNMAWIRAAIAAQVQKDQRRHAETARRVLAVMEDNGVKTLDPQPGQRVKVICTRVVDAMKLGDDPYPALAARRTITTCTGCGENVFIDPASHGPATPEPICARCINPDLAAAMDAAIKAAGKRDT